MEKIHKDRLHDLPYFSPKEFCSNYIRDCEMGEEKGVQHLWGEDKCIQGFGGEN
jgi:hypothetical protein